jgi:hypothetical protein
MSFESLNDGRASDPVPPAVWRALRDRKIVGVFTLVTLAICIVNLPDGRPYQLESAGLFMLSLIVYFGAVLRVRSARDDAQIRSRR